MPNKQLSCDTYSHTKSAFWQQDVSGTWEHCQQRQKAGGMVGDGGM